jgi:hypothetical protein
MYSHPDAAAALEQFGGSQLSSPDGDLEVLCEVAAALGKLRRASSVPVLEAIAGHQGVGLRTRRTAIEAKNAITWPKADPVPKVDEDEIIAHLQLRDTHGEYSDWRVMQQYCAYAMEYISGGEVSPRVVAALVQALGHDQTFARTAVVQCLGRIDSADARAALLEELREPSVPAEVRKACLDGMRKQVAAGQAGVIRAARASLVRWAATLAREGAVAVTADALDEVAELAQSRELRVVTADAFEIAADPAGMTLELCSPEGCPDIAPEALDLAGSAPPDVTGPEYEDKYRVSRITTDGGGVLRVSLTRSSWTQASAFHWALRRTSVNDLVKYDRLLHGWLRHQVGLPGLASVHCIVVSSDDRVLLAQRSPRTTYAQGLWSTSFEEQLTSSDVGTPDHAALSAATRGLREELGLRLTTGSSTRVVSVVMERGILNVSFVAIMTLGEDSRDVEEAWRTGPGATSERELTDLAWLPAEPDVLREMQRRPGNRQLHPTSGLRLVVLARHLEGR